MKRKINIIFAVLISILSLIGLSCEKDNSINVEQVYIICIDTHSQPPYPELGDNVNLPSIIQSMDANSVSKSILSARGEMQYSDDIATFSENNPDRIVAAVSLKLTCMNTDTGFVNNLIKQLNTGKFKAIAEMLLYHAEKFDNNGISIAPERMVDPSNPKVQAVINACVLLNCPVILHIEFVSLENKYGAQKRAQYMNKLKQHLSSNPNQKFILTHVAELNPEQCRTLINDHGNIYFTTNFMDLEALCTGEPVSDYSESEWNTLLVDHSDRFVFAFDRVFPGQWINYTLDMSYFQDKLSNLPNSVANRIAYDNALTLFTLQ